MSSDYDPNQYGMLRFGKGEEPQADRPDLDDPVPEKLAIQGNAPPPAAPPSGTPAASGHPVEDDGDGWAPLKETPTESYSDPLASPVPPRSMPAPPPSPPPPSPPPPTSSPTSLPGPGPGSVAAAKPGAGHAPARSPKPRAPQGRANSRPTPATSAYPFVHRKNSAEWVVPLIVLNVGIGVGAVMFLFYQSLPLGGIAAMLGVIGALFARIYLRESI